MDVLTCPFKLSIDEYANEVGIQNSVKALFLYSMKRDTSLLIDKTILSWCEFKGVISKQKREFKSLLTEHNIDFRENGGLTMLPANFEAATLLMITKKKTEISATVAELKGLLVNYSKYETEYDSIDRSGDTTFRTKVWASKIYRRKLRPRKRKLTVTHYYRKVQKQQKLSLSKNTVLELSDIITPLPKNIFKREELVIFRIHDRECYVIRRQLGSLNEAVHDLVSKFPDAVKILHLSPEANARSLYIRLKEYCCGTSINFRYNNVDLGNDVTTDDFLQTVLDVRAEKFAILKLADVINDH